MSLISPCAHFGLLSNATMFFNNTKQLFIRPCITAVQFRFIIRNKTTASRPASTKLTSSYFHHSSALPLVYKTISQSFDETVAKYPDHECFVFKSKSSSLFIISPISTLGEQKRYTYQSFKQEVDSLAASLLELGFQKNDRLAVWLPNTSENVATSFAASKLGLIKVSYHLHL